MNSRKIFMMSAGALLLAGVLGIQPAAAQPRFRHGPGMHAERLSEELQLSEAQKAQVQTIFASGRENMRALRQELQGKRIALNEAARNEPFDETLVRARAQELAESQAELMVARARLINEALSVVTAEQRDKLQALRAERRQRFMEWRQQ